MILNLSSIQCSLVGCNSNVARGRGSGWWPPQYICCWLLVSMPGCIPVPANTNKMWTYVTYIAVYHMLASLLYACLMHEATEVRVFQGWQSMPPWLYGWGQHLGSGTPHRDPRGTHTTHDQTRAFDRLDAEWTSGCAQCAARPDLTCFCFCQSRGVLSWSCTWLRQPVQDPLPWPLMRPTSL